MMTMVARKSVVSGRQEDPVVVMVDSDSSESTGHYREEKHANPRDDTEGLRVEVPCRFPLLSGTSQWGCRPESL
jgi:hypothetical protein